MNELIFSFGETPWELTLAGLKDGDTLTALRFLTLLEGEDEEAVEAAVQDLEERHITLDIRDLPRFACQGESAARLRMEEDLVKAGDMTAKLEEADPLRLYLEELAGIPVAGDPNVLALELAEGNEEVIPNLTNLMLSRAIDLAKEYTGRGVLLLDLIQEASLGLWQAIGSYTGGNFEAHCDWWIRQYLAVAVTLQARTAGVGQKLRQSLEDYRSADEKLLTELGRNPTVEEIAEAMHITPEDASVIADMLENARLMQRAKAPEPEQLPQEEDQAVEDTAYFQMRQRIAELLSGLSETDAKILTLRYGLEGGLPMDARQVGEKLGLTANDVNEREAAALQKLRQ